MAVGTVGTVGTVGAAAAAAVRVVAGAAVQVWSRLEVLLGCSIRRVHIFFNRAVAANLATMIHRRHAPPPFRLLHSPRITEVVVVVMVVVVVVTMLLVRQSRTQSSKGWSSTVGSEASSIDRVATAHVVVVVTFLSWDVKKFPRIKICKTTRVALFLVLVLVMEEEGSVLSMIAAAGAVVAAMMTMVMIMDGEVVIYRPWCVLVGPIGMCEWKFFLF